jgi:hypothetical protein
MKIDRSWKIEEAVSLDDTRYNLQSPHLEIDKHDPARGTLAATDGHILAVAPVEVEKGDKAGPVSPEALTRARKLAKRGEDAALTATGTDPHRLVDGSTVPRPAFPEGTSFPNWRQIMPAETEKRATPGRFTVAFDVDLLVAASKVVGTKILQVTFTVEKRGESLIPFKVEPAMTADRRGQFAIIMPCHLKG